MRICKYSTNTISRTIKMSKTKATSPHLGSTLLVNVSIIYYFICKLFNRLVSYCKYIKHVGTKFIKKKLKICSGSFWQIFEQKYS